MLRKALIPSALAIVAGACSDQPTAVQSDLYPSTANADAVHFWESNAPVYWNGVSRQLVGTARFNALQATREYAIVSLAQYNAAVAAEKGAGRGAHPSVHAAISAAAVVALSYLHPTEAGALETRLDNYLAEASWPGDKHEDVAAGAAVGRSIGTQVVERAKTDGFFAPWTGTVPTGPGKWFSATPPVGASIGQAKAFFLVSGDQFRPAPPPEFGSPEFNAALAEVKQIASARTPEQLAISTFWNLPAGTHQPPGYWNEEASTLAVRYHLTERETAHTLALMNMVQYDGLVAANDAKYQYWLIRPSQADPSIVLSIGLPNFPSYPSNHATISAGAAQVLAARFPAEAGRLENLAEEAALSRLYGSIHYRFDGEVGAALGRKVAAWALAHDVNGHNPFPLN